ncbi:MAG: MobA/MobL family protein [Sideroxydans sp.]
MTIYHLSVKLGSRKDGGAQKHGRYVRRDPRERFDENHPADALVFNLPCWAEDADHFWAMADKHERKNGSMYREFEIALPNEFTREESVDLVREWVMQEFPHQMVEVGVHWKLGNPHAHIQVCERLDDGLEREGGRYFKRYNSKMPERGGCKKSERFTCNDLPKLAGEGLNDYKRRQRKKRKTVMQEIRGSWAAALNAQLAPRGIALVSHLSNEARGIDEAPGVHIGRKALGLMKRGVIPDRLLEVEIIEERRRDHVSRRRYQKESAENTSGLVDRAAEGKSEDSVRGIEEAAKRAPNNGREKNQRHGTKTVLSIENLDSGHQLRSYFDSLACGIRPVVKIHRPEFENPAYFVDGVRQPIAFGRTDGGVSIPRPQDISDDHLAALLLAVAGKGMAVEVTGTDEFRLRCASLCEHLGIKHDVAGPSAPTADAREPANGRRLSAGSSDWAGGDSIPPPPS